MQEKNDACESKCVDDEDGNERNPLRRTVPEVCGDAKDREHCKSLYTNNMQRHLTYAYHLMLLKLSWTTKCQVSHQEVFRHSSILL